MHNWDKINSKDTILYYNGIRLNRIFTEWTEKKGYSLIIGNSKTSNSYSRMEFGANKSHQDQTYYRYKCIY